MVVPREFADASVSPYLSSFQVHSITFKIKNAALPWNAKGKCDSFVSFANTAAAYTESCPTGFECLAMGHFNAP